MAAEQDGHGTIEIVDGKAEGVFLHPWVYCDGCCFAVGDDYDPDLHAMVSAFMPPAEHGGVLPLLAYIDHLDSVGAVTSAVSDKLRSLIKEISK